MINKALIKINNNNQNNNLPNIKYKKEDAKEIITEYLCQQVSKTLKILNLKRMIIGHNVQQNGKPNVLCNEKLYSIDVGMSHAYGGHLGAIEIDAQNDVVSIITP